MSSYPPRNYGSSPPLSSSPTTDYFAGSSPGPGSNKKAISLNHLLNFSLPPRQKPPQYRSSPQSRKSKSQTSLVPRSKEQFCNANFRFVLKPDGNYTGPLLDPEIIVEWDQIDQVIFTTSEHPACPICLANPPVAPRITKCGHVFCLPCIKRYFTLEPYEAKRRNSPDPTVPKLKQRWRSCPICWESIYEVDTRNVRFWTVNPPPRAKKGTTKSGAKSPTTMDNEEQRLLEDPEYARVVRNEPLGTLDFTLVVRHAGSVLVSPVDEGFTKGSALTSPPLHSDPHALIFAKLMRSTPTYLLDEVYRPDLRELQREFEASNALALTSRQAAESVKEELLFFDMAIEDVKREITRIEKLPKVDNTDSTQRISLPTQSGPQVATSVGPSFLPPSPNDFWFYQSSDGQHYYLHPLDIRILKHEYKHYHAFPPHLHAPVIAFQETTINADLRKRVKYLAHLPLGCDVAFVELDLSKLVSESTLAHFTTDLSSRTQTRYKRARDEAQSHLRAQRSAEKEALSQFGLASSANTEVPGLQDTSAHDNDLEWVIANSIADQSDSAEPTSPRPSTTAASRNGPSFAQIAGSNASWRHSSTTAVSSSSRQESLSSSAYTIDFDFDHLDLDDEHDQYGYGDEVVGGSAARGSKGSRRKKVAVKKISLSSGQRRY